MKKNISYIHVPQGRSALITENQSIANGLYSERFISCCILTIRGINHENKQSLLLAHIDAQYPVSNLHDLISKFKTCHSIEIRFKTKDVAFQNLSRLSINNLKWIQINCNIEAISVDFEDNSVHMHTDTQAPKLMTHPEVKKAQSLYLSYDALFLSTPEFTTRILYDGMHWSTLDPREFIALENLKKRILEYKIQPDDRIKIIADKIAENSFTVDRPDAVFRAHAVKYYLTNSDIKELLCTLLRAAIATLQANNEPVPAQLKLATEDKERAATLFDNILQNANLYSDFTITTLKNVKVAYEIPNTPWNIHNKAEQLRQIQQKQLDEFAQSGFQAYIQKSYPSAIQYYLRSLRLTQELYSYKTKTLLAAYYNLGSAFFRNQQPEEAQPHLTQAFELSRILGIKDEKYRIRHQECQDSTRLLKLSEIKFI